MLGAAFAAVVAAGRDDGRDAQLRRREFERDHARAAVALGAGVRDAAQRAEDDDVAGGHELGTRIHVADHDQVAEVVQRLAAAQRPAVVEGRDADRDRTRRLRDRDGGRSDRGAVCAAGVAGLAPPGQIGAGAGEVGDERARLLGEAHLARRPLARERRHVVGLGRSQVGEVELGDDRRQRVDAVDPVQRDPELGERVAQRRDLSRGRFEVGEVGSRPAPSVEVGPAGKMRAQLVDRRVERTVDGDLEAAAAPTDAAHKHPSMIMIRRRSDA